MSRKGESIFKRKDGRWEARFVRYYGDNGRAVYGYVYGKTYSEVKEKQRDALSDPRQLSKKKEERGITTELLCSKWLDDVRISVKESTFTRYYRTVTKYITPYIGEVRVMSLDAKKINSFSEMLLKSGGAHGGSLSPKTVTDIIAVLKSVLKFGVTHGFLRNTVEGVRYPQRESKKISIFSDANLSKLEGALMDTNDSTAIGILISLFTGLRIGEICGLMWEDIDFKDGLLYVRRTVERIANLELFAKNKTKVIICEPKTESSFRTIPIPAFLKKQLRAYYSQNQSEEHNECYVLTNSRQSTDPRKFYGKYKTFMRRLGMGNYSFHALRHTFATRCVALGFDTKSLSEILGHSNIATTLSVYVHPTINQKRAQMQKLKPLVRS